MKWNKVHEEMKWSLPINEEPLFGPIINIGDISDSDLEMERYVWRQIDASRN